MAQSDSQIGGGASDYPVQLSVDYQETSNRLSVLVRIILAIPILVVGAVIGGYIDTGDPELNNALLPLYAGGQLGFSPVEVGALFSISGVVVFFMIVPAGFVLDKVGRKWATVPSNLIPAVVFLIIPLADTFLQLAVLLSLMGIANGLSLGCLATTTYDVVPQHARGRLQAMRRTIADFVGLGAPAGGGMLANAFHPGIPFLALTPVLWISALLLAFAARETLER